MAVVRPRRPWAGAGFPRLPLLACSLLAFAGRPAGAFEAVPCNATPMDCGLEFFQEVYRLFQTVEHEVMVMPFFIRSELRLFSSREGQAPDLTFEDVVVQTVKRGVHVWVLGWDNSASEKLLDYHQDTMFESLFKATGNNHEHLHLMLDTGRRLLSSVYYLPHIKAYVFDRKTAYVGGLDFAENRLDTPQHIRPDNRLVQVDKDKDHVTGNEKPWQDVMIKVDGPAAGHVAAVLIERWWTYCKSEGYLRAQAMRPLSAVADKLWKVKNSLSVSHWKTYQCSKHPEPATLGTLALSVEGGNTSRRETIKYSLDVVPPAVQSQNLPQGPKAAVALGSRLRREVPVKGLRALDRMLPSEVEFEIDGDKFKAPAEGEAQVELIDGDMLHARWLPNGVAGPPRHEPAPGNGQTCRVTLSGAKTWMGTEEVVKESYEEHIRIIKEAKRFIYIENQYFSTDFPQDSFECRHGDDRTKAVLYSGVHNRIGEVLMERIRRAGRDKEDFGVVVVTPLGTEPGSFYPNLRGTYCFEQALEDYWKKEKLERDWRDYFSFFFLANAVQAPANMGGPGSAFYGIFTHTKVIMADDNVALVGSANINDRSMDGDRDAEVGVLVTGGSFPRRFRERLLGDHVGGASRADPARLLASLREVAAGNARALNASMGISFPEGTVAEGGRRVRLFGLTSISILDDQPQEGGQEAALEYPASRVVAGGGGVDTFQWYVVKGVEPPRLQGLLFPWSRSIWGMPKMTHVGQMLSSELNWRRRRLEEQPGGEGADGQPAVFI